LHYILHLPVPVQLCTGQVYTRVQLPHAREKIVTLRKKWKIYKKRNPKFDTWMAA